VRLIVVGPETLVATVHKRYVGAVHPARAALFWKIKQVRARARDAAHAMNEPERRGWIEINGARAWSRDGRKAARELLRRSTGQRTS
jgi:hypothetical protein